VPRIQPRKEQLIRAQRLKEHGVLELLHPEQLRPENIAKFARDSIGVPPPQLRIDLDGLSKIQELVESLLERPGKEGEIDARKGFVAKTD